MRIIVGLGNPGNQYKNNRHNIGFRCIEQIAEQHSIMLKMRLCQSDTGQGDITGEDVLLVKPRTFMNLSGVAVSCLLNKFKVGPGDLLVIHDDLDLPTGRLRLRLGGSPGGHRGVRSIIDRIGTEDFYRIRIGISRPTNAGGQSWNEDEIIDYVLGDFTDEEEELVKPAENIASQAIECILTEDIDAAMNKFNKRGKTR